MEVFGTILTAGTRVTFLPCNKLSSIAVFTEYGSLDTYNVIFILNIKISIETFLRTAIHENAKFLK